MATGTRDPYEVLGLPRNASADEVKAAFRRLASQNHPDRNQNDPSASVRFKEINQAYQVLSDPERRAAFDRSGGLTEQPGSPFGPNGPFPGGVVDLGDIAIEGILGDLLGVFGVGKGDRGDLKLELELEFTEAAIGTQKTLRYGRIILCEDCRGSGSAPGTVPTACSACSGKGRVRLQQAMFPLAVEKACPRCNGTGRFVTHPCQGCKGKGLVKQEHEVLVSIPPGVEDGAAQVVPRAGNRPRPDKPAGDLLLTIRVKPHPFFRRIGDDVVCKVPISFAQAALGAEIEVPTLEGKGKLKVPAGTQPGAVLRIRNKGIPRGGSRGDQRVEVQVAIPERLTPKQRALMEELAKDLNVDTMPEQKGFVDLLKNLFG